MSKIDEDDQSEAINRLFKEAGEKAHIDKDTKPEEQTQPEGNPHYDPFVDGEFGYYDFDAEDKKNK